MRELHEICLLICLQLILKRNTNPLKCADIFFLCLSWYRYYNSGSYLKIQRVKKRSGCHFNDTDRSYDVQKSLLKVILMTRTEDTTQKSDLEVILLLRNEDTTCEKWKKKKRF